MSEQEIQRDLAALREDGIPAEEFAAMRSAVLREVRARPGFPWGWAAVAAAIVVCVSAAVLMPRRSSPIAPTPPLIAKITAAPAPVLRVAHRKPRHRVALKAVPEPVPALTVKFITSDPDVVIIWQFDKSGE